MDLEGLPPVGGILESSLVHWEGHVAAVVFLQGCNLACPSCPVPHLVARAPGPGADPGAASWRGRIPVESVLDVVFSRRHLLDGVVVAGGEPTLHATLPDLLEVLRSFGLRTRLHTNGTRPRALGQAIGADLVDSVQLTLQAPLNALYPVAAGTEVDLGGIYRSVELLLGRNGDDEFRLAVDPRLLTKEDVLRVGRTVAGARRLVLAPVGNGPSERPGKRLLRSLARLAGPFVESCTVAGEPARDYGRRSAAATRRRGALGVA